MNPTEVPTGVPTKYPTNYPTVYPTEMNSEVPTTSPSIRPSASPTQQPSLVISCKDIVNNVSRVIEPWPYTINSHYSPGAQAISDGGGDMYDNGNLITVDGVYLYYLDNCEAGTVNEQSYTMSMSNAGFSVTLFSPYSSYSISITGGLGADGGGFVERGSYQSGRWNGFWKVVYGESDPSVNHLWITDAPSATHKISTDSDKDFDELSNVRGFNVIYILWATESNYKSSDNIKQQLVCAVSGIPWLPVSHSGISCDHIVDMVNNVTEPNKYTIKSDYSVGKYSIWDGGDDMYDNGNFINVSGHRAVYLDDCDIDTVNGQQYAMELSNEGFSVTLFSPYYKSQISIYGGLGADGQGTVETGSYHWNGWNGFWKVVYIANDPGINHLWVTDAPSARHEVSKSTDDDRDVLSNIYGYNVVYLLWATKIGSKSSDSVMQQLVSAVSASAISCGQIVNKINNVIEPRLATISSEYYVEGVGIRDGGNDIYDYGNYINVNGSALSYLENCEIGTVNGQQYTMALKNSGFSVTLFSPYYKNWISIVGELGADNSGKVESGSYQYNGWGGFWKVVYGAYSDPGVNHLWVTDAPSARHNFATLTDDDWDELSNVYGYNVIYLLWFTESYYRSSDYTMQQLVIAIATENFHLVNRRLDSRQHLSRNLSQSDQARCQVNPKGESTPAPSWLPSSTPTRLPTTIPSWVPTSRPTVAPTSPPSHIPSLSPSASPSARPTLVPTKSPSHMPSLSPSASPSVRPTPAPSKPPSRMPSLSPSASPSVRPTPVPTKPPSNMPSLSPSATPSSSPSELPSKSPSHVPTIAPTLSPSVQPTPAPTYQTPLIIRTLHWDTTVTTLSLSFSGDTNTPGNLSSAFDCVRIFDLSTAVMFGSEFDGSSQNQYCKWEELDTLVVTLGYGATVVPGDILQFIVSQTDCKVWICHLQIDGQLPFTSNLTVTVPGVHFDAYPIPSVEAPAAVGLCDDITMASSSSGGYGRAFKAYVWTLPEWMEENCSDVVTNSSELRISGNCTSEMESTVLNFNLNVTNWLLLSNELNISIAYEARAMPRVVVRGSNTYYSSRITTLEIPIDVDMPTCHPNQTYAFTYLWRQEKSGNPFDHGWPEGVAINSHELFLTETQTRAKRLVIPSYSTHWGMYYMFTVTVSHYDAISNSTVVAVKIDDRPMPAIKESDTLTFSFATDNEILLKTMFDFFVELKERSNWWENVAATEEEAILVLYNISWYCNVGSNVRTIENCDIAMSRFDNRLGLRFSLEETRNLSSGIRYEFTARVQSLNKTVESSISVFVTEQPYPVVSLFPNSVSLTIGNQVTFILMITKSSDISTGLKLEDEAIFSYYNVTWSTYPDLSAYPYAFTVFENVATLDTTLITSDFLDKIIVTVQVVPHAHGEVFYEGHVTKSASVSLNFPPRMGTCTVNPATGTAFSTIFTVQCSEWNSDTALEYQFSTELNSTVGEDVALLTYSRSSKHEFESGPGNFKIKSLIKDARGAFVERFNYISVKLSAKEAREMETNTESYVNSISESANATLSSAATVGDMSAVFGKIAEVNSIVDIVYTLSIDRRRLIDDNILLELYQLKKVMVESIGVLLTAITPSLVSLDAVTTALRTIVMDSTLFPEDSVILVASQLELLINSTSHILSEEYVSKFPPLTVLKLVDSANSMLRATIDQEHWNVTTSKRLRDSGKRSLKESLRDTHPGQVGFAKDMINNYGRYFAKRVSTHGFSMCSTSQTWLPDFIPEFQNSKSGDCLTFVDNEDYGFEGKRRRRTEQGPIDQQVISIELYESSERNVDNSVTVGTLDMCDPVVVALDVEVVTGNDHENFVREISHTLQSSDNTDNMTYMLPSCESRHGLGDEWVKTGCTLIRWDQKRTWCSCTHLTDISASPKDISIAFSKVFKNRNTLPINYETVKSHPTAPLCAIILTVLLIRLLPEVPMRSTDRELLAQPYIFTNRGFKNIVIHSVFFKKYQALAKGAWARMFWLFAWEVRNHHPILGIWCRDMGTNYTGHQRVIVVFVGLSTSLAMEAFFYGVTWTQPLEELLTSIAVSCIVSLLPFIAKHAMTKHKTEVLDSVYNVEKARMQSCRAGCRYMSCCCFCGFYKHGRYIARHTTVFPADCEDLLFETKANQFWISDRRRAIIQSTILEEFDVRKGVQIRKGDKKFKKLEDWQKHYLKKQHNWPKWMRIFAWTVLLLYLLGCCTVIFSYGVNFDRDEEAEVPPEIVAAATTQCQPQEFDDRPLQTDVAVDSTINFAASNMSAEIINSEYIRYPQSSLELFSESTTESFRFLSSSISAWLVGVFLIPFLKNLFNAIGTLILYHQFSINVDETCRMLFCSEIYIEEAEKLKSEDFKFLFLLFPTNLPIDLEHRDGDVPKGLPVIKKRKCKKFMGAFAGCVDN